MNSEDITNHLSKTLMLVEIFIRNNKDKQDKATKQLFSDLMDIIKVFNKYQDVHYAMAVFNDNNGHNQAEVNQAINKAVFDTYKVFHQQNEVGSPMANLATMYIKKIQIQYLLLINAY